MHHPGRESGEGKRRQVRRRPVGRQKRHAGKQQQGWQEERKEEEEGGRKRKEGWVLKNPSLKLLSIILLILLENDS